jgi:hypothetical protein
MLSSGKSGNTKYVMANKKELRDYGGLKLDGPVTILTGPNTPKIEEVRKLGVAGFLVKTRSVTYYWSDKGITWDFAPSHSPTPQ